MSMDLRGVLSRRDERPPVTLQTVQTVLTTQTRKTVLTRDRRRPTERARLAMRRPSLLSRQGFADTLSKIPCFVGIGNLAQIIEFIRCTATEIDAERPIRKISLLISLLAGNLSVLRSGRPEPCGC
jgi:hypothetical protein